MTLALTVKHEQLVHSASFVRPPFELWGEGKAIAEGIFDTFAPFGVTLSDIRVETGATLADQVVNVTIGGQGVYRFRFDKVEATFLGFSEEFFQRIPALLGAATKWIRIAAPSVRFASHQFVYSAHSVFKANTAEEFLKRFAPAAPRSGGADRGTGLVFHWDVPTKNWVTQLVLDKSAFVPDGLFVSLTFASSVDSIDFGLMASDGRSYLAQVLKELDLQFEDSA